MVREAAGGQTGLQCGLVSKVKEGAGAWWEHGQEALGSRDSLGRGEEWEKIGNRGWTQLGRALISRQEIRPLSYFLGRRLKGFELRSNTKGVIWRNVAVYTVGRKAEGLEAGSLQLTGDAGLAWVVCWEWRVKWPGRDEGEGWVCKESLNWIPLPLPLSGRVTLGKSPNLSGPVFSFVN